MAHINPFRAYRYNPARVDVSSCVTQPYDKITPEMQAKYYQASPQNLVRIILGKPESGDGQQNNVYTRAAASFGQWRSDGVLQQEPEPAIYHYIQRFTPPGSTAAKERRGFIALGRIEDYSAEVVFRHEQTLAKPKADRLDLLRHTRAHFGQIFMLYSDPEDRINAALSSSADAPIIEVTDEYEVTHTVWKVSDRERIEFVRDHMGDKKLIIADGHHRYETALNYRNECRASAGPGSAHGDLPAYEFTMMTFVNMDSPGLTILPTHRVIYGLESFSAEEFRQRARKYFSVDEVDANIDASRAQGILRGAGHSGTAILAVAADRAFLIDTPRGVGSEMFEGMSLRQQSLDVVQLHRCLLETILGLSQESIREQRNLRYLRDAGEAIASVRNGEANIAFLLNPVRMQQVRDIAFAGEVLPQKSTDFYPKLLSGLTIYALD
jgi:uncharacterized protein (DUF1015 family)